MLPPKLAEMHSRLQDSVPPWLHRLGGNRRTAALRASALGLVLLLAAGALLI